ncbi:MAG: 23S rRNA (guanosine(2251)-2'-O)-methyltransferase RlmB [Solirubrobacterales bacterium]
MILYGRNPVLEAIRGRRAVLRAWVARERDIAALPADLDATIVSAEEIERLCSSPDHQGLACEAGDYPYSEANELLAADDALLVAIDEVQDPRNLGAICRSAECAGASGVVMPERRSAQITPTVCRASAGAVEHLAIARVRNLADYLGHAKQAGAWIYGADAKAAVPYTQPDYRGRVVLVLGSEGKGLRKRVADSCDQLVSVPIKGRIDSLNVSAVAAVLLYEAVRQRTN